MPSLLLLLGAVLTTGACAAVEGNAATDDDEINASSGLAQMNDVSVLYPLPKTREELERGYLGANAKGRGGDLLPYDVLSISGLPESTPEGPVPIGQDTEMVYGDLKVVAFRIDPCFAHIGTIEDPSACKNQLRLVFQDVSFHDGAGTIDGAVHAFYDLTRAELVELVKAMIAIREDAGDEALGPLAVHPLLASQGVLGAAGTKMHELVLRYAGAENLSRFTFFLPGVGATAWHFSGFDVANGRTTPMEIPALPAGTVQVSFFSGFLPGQLVGQFTPSSTSADSIELLGNMNAAREAGLAKTKAAIDAAFRIENPDRHSPDTIDCASCHVAGPGITLGAHEFDLPVAKNPNAFRLDSAFVTEADMAQTTPVKPSDDSTVRNFHAFSYRDATPMISRRVINETAAVVDYLDRHVLPTNR